MKNKLGVTGVELLKYLVVIFIVATLTGLALTGCIDDDWVVSGRYKVKTPYFECTGVLYYNPVRFKCDDGTIYYYITNYTLKEINND